MNIVGASLGAAVLHMIWQGAVIGWVLWIVLRLLRRRSPELRYVLGCGAMLFMACTFVITFTGIYRLHGMAKVPTAVSYQPSSTAALVGIPQPMLPIWIAPATSRLQWLNTVQSLAFPVWCLGVLLCSLRLVKGCSKAYSLAWRCHDPEHPVTALVSAIRRKIGLNREVRVAVCETEEGVSVIGWLKPVVLLPPSVLAGLGPDEMEAVIAHELAHVLRHDYVINVLQSIIETLLFFHPLTWWISNQIRTERELCCDRMAVRICGNRQDYAQALLKLARMQAAPFQFNLAATGGPLLQRVELLFGLSAHHLKPPHWSSLLTLVIGLACVSLNFNWSRLLGEATEPLRFEVASVKVNHADDGRIFVNGKGTRFVAHGVSVRFLLRLAYDVQHDQVVGGPKWLDSARFDIEATEPIGTPHPIPVIGGPPPPRQLMVRSLLADRFGLSVHRETRERPVFRVALARRDGKLGPYLQRVDVDCNVLYAPLGRKPGSTSTTDPGRCGTKLGPGILILRAQTMGQLAATLSTLLNAGMALDKPVVDGTGLAGVYDATLRFTPDRIPNLAPEALEDPIDPDGPSLFTAMQEQLGLKLEPRTGPVDVLVVDRVEQPSEN